MKRTVIRLNRKNEFNSYWAFLIICQTTIILLMLTAQNLYYFIFLVIGSLLILLIGILYQGFEVIIDKNNN